MCLIILADSQKPSLDILKRGEACNKDGAGVVWFDKNQKLAQFKKGLKAEEVFELIQDKDLPILIHFRFTSSGTKDQRLNHPFIVSKESPLLMEGEADRLLVHNGTFSDWEICLQASGIYPDDFDKDKEPMSDTRAIAMIVSENERFLYKASGKFVFVKSENKLFQTYGDFDLEEGIYYSNKIWKYRGDNQCQNYHYMGEREGGGFHYSWDKATQSWKVIDVTEGYSGLDREDVMGLAAQLTPKQRKRYLKRLARYQTLNSLDIRDLNTKEQEEEQKLLREQNQERIFSETVGENFML